MNVVGYAVRVGRRAPAPYRTALFALMAGLLAREPGFSPAAEGASGGADSANRLSENRLSGAEAAEGWRLLFNGRDTEGWKTNTGEAPAVPVEDGCLRPHKAGGYLICYTGAQFEDFTLRCEVRMAPPFCNSGIFFRMSELRDPPRHALECQIANLNLARDDAYGAIYDLAEARKRIAKHKMWDWHEVEIRCDGPLIEVRVDGDLFSTMNCDEYKEPGVRPDGRKHKFPYAPADLPRRGWIGLQDHGSEVWFRNIRILDRTERGPAADAENADGRGRPTEEGSRSGERRRLGENG